MVKGWSFRFQPTLAAEPYEFLAFRSPAERGPYHVAVLAPEVARTTPGMHMKQVRVDATHELTVIDPPGPTALTDLPAVRICAAKWAAYASSRLAGRAPGFRA